MTKWTRLANEVLLAGRPADIEAAADAWEVFVYQLGDAPRNLELDLRELEQNWRGEAADAFATELRQLNKNLALLVEELSRGGGMSAVLHDAAERLAQAQQAMPVPQAAVADLLAARQNDAVLDLGVLEARFEADALRSTPAKALAWINDQIRQEVTDAEEKAQQVYDALNKDFEPIADRTPEISDKIIRNENQGGQEPPTGGGSGGGVGQPHGGGVGGGAGFAAALRGEGAGGDPSGGWTPPVNRGVVGAGWENPNDSPRYGDDEFGTGLAGAGTGAAGGVGGVGGGSGGSGVGIGGLPGSGGVGVPGIGGSGGGIGVGGGVGGPGAGGAGRIPGGGALGTPISPTGIVPGAAGGRGGGRGGAGSPGGMVGGAGSGAAGSGTRSGNRRTPVTGTGGPRIVRSSGGWANDDTDDDRAGYAWMYDKDPWGFDNDDGTVPPIIGR
jgi:uncharacterized protein YukE